MKIVRYEWKGMKHWGVLDQTGEHVREGVGSFFGDWGLTKKIHALDSIKFLSPVEPTKIVALGLNYRDHAEEMHLPLPENPIIFLKPSSSVIAHKDVIIYPSMSVRVDYEAEFAIVISKLARRVPPEESRRHILGYTCVNDVTARDLQGKDGQWSRAKSFDTFCPIGPWIVTDVAPDDLAVEAYLNGERKQSSRTSNLIFGIDMLVSFISHIMTLYPGDVISTGTPGGIGPMQPGDTIEIRIENIGSLINKVVAE